MTEPHELPSTLSGVLSMAEPLNAPITKGLLAEIVGSGDGVRNIDPGHSIISVTMAVLQLELRLNSLEARIGNVQDDDSGTA